MYIRKRKRGGEVDLQWMESLSRTEKEKDTSYEIYDESYDGQVMDSLWFFALYFAVFVLFLMYSGDKVYVCIHVS